MKKIMYLAMLKVKLVFRNKVSAISMVAVPIIFVAVLSLAYGSGSNVSKDVKYKVAIVNEDGGNYSKQLVDFIQKDKSFNIIEGSSGDLKGYLRDGKAETGLVIHKGFSESVEGGTGHKLELVKLQDNESTAAAASILENYANLVKLQYKAGEISADTLISMKKTGESEKSDIKYRVETEFANLMTAPKIGYETEKVVKEKKQGLDDMSAGAIGIIVMFIMLFASRGSGSILEEKELGTWSKVQSTPVNQPSILLGYGIGNFLIGGIQVAVLILASRFLFNVNWGNSLMALILLFSSFLIAIIGLGTTLASFVKSKAQMNTLIPIIVVPTSLLAGCMWPRELMPDFMINLSNYLPQTWVLKGMTDLGLRGSDINSILVPCAVLLLFASIFFIIGSTIASLKSRA